VKGALRTREELERIRRRVIALATSGRLVDTPEVRAAVADSLRHLDALIPLIHAVEKGEKGRGLS